MQCEQMNNLRKRIPNNTIRHFLYSLTRCLDLQSKMCATQMNTSDNRELWDIPLKSIWEVIYRIFLLVHLIKYEI